MKEVVDRLLATYPESEIGIKISDFIETFIQRPEADGKLVERDFKFLDDEMHKFAVLYFNYKGQKYAFWQGPMKFIGLSKLEIIDGDIEVSTIWADVHPLMKEKKYDLLILFYFNPIIRDNV